MSPGERRLLYLTWGVGLVYVGLLVIAVLKELS